MEGLLSSGNPCGWRTVGHDPEFVDDVVLSKSWDHLQNQPVSPAEQPAPDLSLSTAMSISANRNIQQAEHFSQNGGKIRWEPP